MPMLVRGRSTGLFSTATTPFDPGISPATIISSVLLPQPLGPRIDRNSPRGCWMDTRSSARTTPSRVA